jgi:hypothetical protein
LDMTVLGVCYFLVKWAKGELAKLRRRWNVVSMVM